jgi:hypothetical protein
MQHAERSTTNEQYIGRIGQKLDELMDNGIHLSFTLLVVVFTAISVVSIH